MESTTNGTPVQSGPADDRWCAACDGPIGGDGEIHDEELVCRACGLKARLEAARDALADAEDERESAELERDDREEQHATDLADLRSDYECDLAELDRSVADCERVVTLARARLAVLLEEAEEAAGVAVPPISGGAPFEPTAADWADYHAWRDEVDRELPDPEPEARYGYE